MSKALQTTANTPGKSLSVTEELPEHLKHLQGQTLGLEDSDKDDFVLPRLAICQSLTPQRKKSDPKYIEGLEEGDFFNTVSGEKYGTSVNFIPLFLTKQRIKFKDPIGSGIDCQSLNGKTGGHYSPESCRACEFSKFGSSPKGEGQACTEFKNIVGLVEGAGSPVVFSTKSSMLSTTKQWLSQIKMANMPMFSRVWKLSTTPVQKNGNDYFSYLYSSVRWVAKDAYDRCEAFFNSLHDKTIVFDPEDMDADDTAGDEGAF